jgi:hypothetical protein
MEFTQWLMSEKGFTTKAAHDVLSRLKRVQKLLDSEEIPDDVTTKLEASDEFKEISMCVRSQLRRSAKLYIEYKAKS